MDNAGNAEKANNLVLKVDTLPPVISLDVRPRDVDPSEQPQVVVTVKDVRGIENVTCLYTINGTETREVVMSGYEGTYACTLPGLPDKSYVSYWIWA